MQISVIIPTRDRPQALARCLQGLIGQKDFSGEVIVVNDGRSALPFLPKYPQVKELKTDGGVGQAAAKNLGAQYARGEILAFLDDDCVPHLGWLFSLTQPLHDPRIAATVGRIHEKRTTQPYDTIRDLVLNLPFVPFYHFWRQKVGGTIYFNGRVDKDLESTGQGPCHWGGAGNMAVRTAAFRQVKGFDEHWLPGCAMEEPDLCWRLRQQGGRIFYLGRAVVEHYAALSRRCPEKARILNLRANEIYFALKNIAFRSFVHFGAFMLYQAWQVLVYFCLAAVKHSYWWRVQGKFLGLRHWAKWNFHLHHSK